MSVLTRLDAVDPVPTSKYPSFQAVNTPLPLMPSAWSAIALLHPFSPPLSSDPKPDSPFFQLCTARIDYSEGDYLSAQITGCEYGTWWYVVTQQGTQLSMDKGKTWSQVDMGWILPKSWFEAASASAGCAGSSPLNWMVTKNLHWWKAGVPNTSPPAAIWMWFDSTSGAPVRMMFGQGPPTTTKGDPGLLAIFQMYSFTYIASFDRHSNLPPRTDLRWTPVSVSGFAVGNPNNYKNFVWNTNFGMTAFMTPVNGHFNPLPTRILYVWKPHDQYSAHIDRVQHTLMGYEFNLHQPSSPPLKKQIALLTGPAPAGMPDPPDSSTGFLISQYADGTDACGDLPFPQQPPNWVSLPGVEARIRATIKDNPVLCPNRTITVFSVLFPPSPPNYPESTYLWTWYSPENADGTVSRPVTFMQSQSGINLGTSLALADYFHYETFARPIDPENFIIPTACSTVTRNIRLRHSPTIASLNMSESRRPEADPEEALLPTNAKLDADPEEALLPTSAKLDVDLEEALLPTSAKLDADPEEALLPTSPKLDADPEEALLPASSKPDADPEEALLPNSTKCDADPVD